ncbi:hypothetical protein EON77_10070 [bacterium]|nr:MAG: hypothetical protein EON77_10070 [bacterium]
MDAHLEDGRYAEAFAAFGEDKYDDLSAYKPDDLFRLADTARLASRPRHAALAFDELRSKYPRDSRAGIAALQLGRLRLLDLDDAAGAKEALDDAIRLNPEGFLREDAQARRVQALEEVGDHAGCLEARDAYLATYPQGVHAVSLARRCR